ncbi:oxidoreductase [Tsukamurella tyrosinosolvens]|uniref:PDR/VanB family oxidoreductase n=1 Tax=Tsukamurella tyrosinosolvens TaxID=57704 RepID=UPI001CE0C7F0|nr:PDR/VanB family oxidoreductase [Tsukamurella tyrosinosolvens]MCA4997891.1 oxidoreductase [Tsukamurella tyrosinosolvens]
MLTKAVEPLTAAAAADGLVLRISEKRFVAEGVCELTLREPNGRRLPDWSAGSHIDLVLPGELTRQYSLCGDRWDPFQYRVAVLREPNGRGGSTYIHDTLSVGDVIAVGGPRNNFHLAPARRYAFIAGGIGITPILAMIDHANRLGAEWSLLYGGRSLESMAYVDILESDPRVSIRPQDRCGHLDLASVLDADLTDTQVYCCGPTPLLEALLDRSAHLPAGTVRIERFVPCELDAPARSAAFDVELQQSGITVTVEPDQSVLEAINIAGVAVLSSCRQGTCGTCEAGVINGSPDHRDSLLTDDERQRNDCMFVCVSRSCSDRLVLDL